MKVYLQKGEKTLYRATPKGKILVLWFFTRVIFYSFAISFLLNYVFIFLGIINFMAGGAFAFAYNYLLVFVGIIILVFLYHVALRSTYKYYITDERVILEGGILLRKIKSVPYHKITDVSISQNILERVLGISKANVHTAGTGMQRPEIQFVGLINPERPQSIIVKELRAFKSSRHASTYSE